MSYTPNIVVLIVAYIMIFWRISGEKAFKTDKDINAEIANITVFMITIVSKLDATGSINKLAKFGSNAAEIKRCNESKNICFI